MCIRDRREREREREKKKKKKKKKKYCGQWGTADTEIMVQLC